ncbi:MAG: hypothetical protein HFE30_08130 [Clostridiales bacterium]|nr:hypothetical protein [Clostridiales bacterium]
MNKPKKVHWLSAIIGISAAICFGNIATAVLENITDGLWSIEEGAPWIAIYIVVLFPAICGGVFGLTRGVGHALFAGIILPFITAIIDYFTCILIGIFLDGSGMTLVVSILFLLALFAGPGQVLIIFIFDD